MNSFGVYNVTNANATLYQKVTWVELAVALSAPSGGPYSIKVNWRGEDWAFQQGIIPNLSTDARFGLAVYNSGAGLEYGVPQGLHEEGDGRCRPDARERVVGPSTP